MSQGLLAWVLTNKQLILWNGLCSAHHGWVCDWEISHGWTWAVWTSEMRYGIPCCGWDTARSAQHTATLHAPETPECLLEVSGLQSILVSPDLLLIQRLVIISPLKRMVGWLMDGWWIVRRKEARKQGRSDTPWVSQFHNVNLIIMVYAFFNWSMIFSRMAFRNKIFHSFLWVLDQPLY